MNFAVLKEILVKIFILLFQTKIQKVFWLRAPEEVICKKILP